LAEEVDRSSLVVISIFVVVIVFVVALFSLIMVVVIVVMASRWLRNSGRGSFIHDINDNCSVNHSRHKLNALSCRNKVHLDGAV
jgi:flagellar basal body-associated protein FliL